MSDPKYYYTQPFDPAERDPAETHAQAMRWVPRNARILEVGCASGYLSAYMERALGCEVTCVEPDPVMADIARGRCTRLIQGSIEDSDVIAQIGGGYDVLMCLSVLEHLLDPERVLRTLAAALKPGGEALIALPNVAHWRIRLMLARGRWRYEDYGVMDRTHLVFYTFHSAQAMIKRAGYSITETSIAGSFLQAWANRLTGGRAPLLWPNLFAWETLFRAEPDRGPHGA